jgi:hypothetical protein
MTDEAVVERLDRMIAILRLAHGDSIARARTLIRSDKVNAAILDASAKWVGAAKLQTTVAAKTKASTRTIQERIADLVTQGVLEKRGAASTTEYKASGLI